ncbi:hypothetical protein ME793_16620 [Lactobacillus delbrueckii]|nr:hypothetical protein ME793_16620 [Lactobacillus delbrueckii]
MTLNLTVFTDADSQNLLDVMLSVQFVLAIGELNTKGKLHRCNFLIKNKIWKSGLVRNMGLLAFC